MREWLVRHAGLGSLVRVAWTAKGAVRKVRKAEGLRWVPGSPPPSTEVSAYVRPRRMAQVDWDRPFIVPESVYE